MSKNLKKVACSPTEVFLSPIWRRNGYDWEVELEGREFVVTHHPEGFTQFAINIARSYNALDGEPN